MWRALFVVIASILLLVVVNAPHKKDLIEIVEECESPCTKQMEAVRSFFNKQFYDELLATAETIVKAADAGATPPKGDHHGWLLPGFPAPVACKEWIEDPPSYMAVLLACSEWDGRADGIRAHFDLPGLSVEETDDTSSAP
jgi:hypothetical protein